MEPCASTCGGGGGRARPAVHQRTAVSALRAAGWGQEVLSRPRPTHSGAERLSLCPVGAAALSQGRVETPEGWVSWAPGSRMEWGEPVCSPCGGGARDEPAAGEVGEPPGAGVPLGGVHGDALFPGVGCPTLRGTWSAAGTKKQLSRNQARSLGPPTSVGQGVGSGPAPASSRAVAWGRPCACETVLASASPGPEATSGCRQTGCRAPEMTGRPGRLLGARTCGRAPACLPAVPVTQETTAGGGRPGQPSRPVPLPARAALGCHSAAGDGRACHHGLSRVRAVGTRACVPPRGRSCWRSARTINHCLEEMPLSWLAGIRGSSGWAAGLGVLLPGRPDLPDGGAWCWRDLRLCRWPLAATSHRGRQQRRSTFQAASVQRRGGSRLTGQSPLPVLFAGWRGLRGFQSRSGSEPWRADGETEAGGRGGWRTPHPVT